MGDAAETRLSKPSPPHNHLMAPGVCMCVDCCRKVLALRCPKWNQSGDLQCGDYKGHRGDHTLLISTEFLIAEERVRLDAKAEHG